MVEYWLIQVQLIATFIGFGLIAYYLLKRQINETIGAVMEGFTGMFLDPQVKRASTILGKESGRVRAEKATTEDIAQQVLSNPQIQGWKMIAKTALGIDLDEMIEEHGAVETLAGLKQIGETLGIDITQLLVQGAKGINTTTDKGVTTSQYLKG